MEEENNSITNYEKKILNAIQQKSNDEFKYYYKQFLNLNPTVRRFDNYIKHAIHFNKFSFFKCLVNGQIKRMRNPKQPNFNKNMISNVQSVHPKYLCYLMKKGHKIDINNIMGATATLNKNAVNISKNLINSSKININKITKKGVTVLWNAARNGLCDMVKMLIDKGADVNKRTEYNVKYNNGNMPLCGTALHIATFKGHLCVVKLLIEKGANINIIDKREDTPLKIALIKYTTGNDKKQSEMRNIVVELLKAHLKKNNKVSNFFKSIDSYKGLSPLITAAGFGDIEMIDLLLKSGADVNIKVSKNTKTTYNSRLRGKTPVHIASGKGFAKTVEYLIEHGADINIRDDNLSLPIETAIKKHNLTVIKLLFEQHVKNNTVNNINKGMRKHNKVYDNLIGKYMKNKVQLSKLANLVAILDESYKNNNYHSQFNKNPNR